MRAFFRLRRAYAAPVEAGIVQFEQVAFRYRRRAPWVRRDVTLTVPRGRVVEVNGANGAGKSTLLRLLAGVVPPVRGRVSGRPSRVGFAPERFPAARPFTARAYLSHLARSRGAPATRADDWASRLDTGTRAALPSLLSELAADGASVIVSDHQGDLRELPDIVRRHVSGHTVTTGDVPDEYTIVEVTVR